MSLPLRILLATLVVAGAFGGAQQLRHYTFLRFEANYADCQLGQPCRPGPAYVPTHPRWADSAALAATIVGIGGAAAILAIRRRPTLRDAETSPTTPKGDRARSG